MKAVYNNIINFLLVMGMIMVSSSVSAETRERTTRTVGGNRTVATESNTYAGGRRTANASASTSSTNQNKDKATVDARNNSISRSSSANTGNLNRPVTNNSISRSSSANTGNLNRPVTNNSGNNNANHWPNQNKPTVVSNNPGAPVNSSANRANTTARPADLKNGNKNNGNKNNGVIVNNNSTTTRPADLKNGSLARPGTMNGNSYNNSNYNRHGYITSKPASWNAPVAPPTRTYRPADHKILRPVAPKNYRPYVSAPRITGFLGLTFGESYYRSLDYLFDRGYEIDGFYNNTIYLRNVTELNFFWPDAIINYNSRGIMQDAEFHYSTRYDDNSRFSRLYSNLRAIYGSPVSYKAKKNKYEIIWYGGDARGFITLEYYKHKGRYYTTVAYGY